MPKRILLCVLSIFLMSTTFFANSSGLFFYKPKEPTIDKLLIVVLVQNIENRRTLEEELAYDLSDYGIRAVLSHSTRLGGADNITKEDVKKVCAKHGANGVLMVKLVDLEKQNSYSYNQEAQYTGAGAPTTTSTGIVFTNRGTYSWGTYAYGNYFDAVSSNVMEIQSDLIYVETEELLFQEDSKFRVGEVEEAIGKFSKTLTKKVVKTKHFQTSKKK